MHQAGLRTIVSWACGVAIVTLILSTMTVAEASAAVRAGVASVNITADKPTSPVHDPLMAKALVLEDGGKKAVIISIDLIEATDRSRGVRRGVQQEVGIDPSCVLVNASHNHRTRRAGGQDVVCRGSSGP